MELDHGVPQPLEIYKIVTAKTSHSSIIIGAYESSDRAEKIKKDRNVIIEEDKNRKNII